MAPSATPSRVISCKPARDERGARVVAEANAFDDAGRDGHDVLERTAKLDADHVVVRVDAKRRAAQRRLRRAGRVRMLRRRDDRRRLTSHDLGGEARAGDSDDRVSRDLFVDDRRHEGERLLLDALRGDREHRVAADAPRRWPARFDADGATASRRRPTTRPESHPRSRSSRARRARSAVRARSAGSRARVDRRGDVGLERPQHGLVAIAGEQIGERRAPRAGTDDRAAHQREPRRDENGEHDDETDRQRRRRPFRRNASLPEPMLLAVAQPGDVRAMRPEHERRRRATLIANTGDRTPTVNAEQHRKHQAARQRSERHEAARQQHDGEDDQREERLNGREREKHAGRRRDALPAASELEVDRSHVADDRRDAADDRRR